MSAQTLDYGNILTEGEAVLWKHVVSNFVTPKPMPAKIAFMIRVFTGAFALYCLYNLWQMRATIEMGDVLLTSVAGIVIMLFFGILYPKIMKAKSISAFQNALITNQRLILYNHNQDGQMDLYETPLANIVKLVSDFEMGSPAIRFNLNLTEKLYVTVFGNFDVNKTKQEIRKHLNTARCS